MMTSSSSFASFLAFRWHPIICLVANSTARALHSLIFFFTQSWLFETASNGKLPDQHGSAIRNQPVFGSLNPSLTIKVKDHHEKRLKNEIVTWKPPCFSASQSAGHFFARHRRRCGLGYEQKRPSRVSQGSSSSRETSSNQMAQSGGPAQAAQTAPSGVNNSRPGASVNAPLTNGGLLAAPASMPASNFANGSSHIQVTICQNFVGWRGWTYFFQNRIWKYQKGWVIFNF